MSNDFRGIGVAMSREFVKGLGLPYNFQLDRMLRDVPIIDLQPAQLEAMQTYMRMVWNCWKRNVRSKWKRCAT